uniref:BRCA1-associated ATM activator 1 n=1 Tax=Maylandia zebra TaxID=106582 RepID=A0A3P9C0M8_9CICH
MDRECVSLLPRVCEVLAASGSSLPDDTILEKLLDWFTALTEAGESLLEACPCLLEFISAVMHDTASAPGVLSFTLRLIGLLAAAEDDFIVLKESLVLDLVFSCQHWQELGLWEDPCIRIGWIQGLRTTLQHPNGLSFFRQPLLQLQTDTSLFVASAANQMLAHVLLFCQPEDEQNTSVSKAVVENPAEPMEINQDCTAVVDAISEYLKRALGVPKGSAQLHQCQQTLRLLALLLGQTKPPLHDKLLQTVTASLEEMVAADCSELTLPLMDVILDPDCLPCAPDLIVSGILSLLRICSGDSSSSSAGCSEVFRNVIGSGKVQKCALEALTAVSNSPGEAVLHKSYQALVKWMSVSCAIDLHNKSHCLCLLDLVQVVKKRACDMRWEVRDSTMEFLGHLGAMRVCRAPAEQACDASEALLGGCCCTTPLLREALQDPESYVRASAIKALAQTVMHSWQEGAAPTQEQILSQDTEGFARRAVVKFFIAWFSSHTSHTPPSSPSVRSVLSRGCADLDWEVKVHTLELAELLLDKAFLGHGSYTKGSDSLVEQGVISALLSGLVDCDRPVALKACRLLITLRVTVCPASQGDPDVSDATANAERDLNALNATSFEDHSEEGASAVSHCERVSVCEALGSLGLDDRLEILSRSSDHVHNSPLSLLQDILTASTSHTHSNTQPGQEVIVDCY